MNLDGSCPRREIKRGWIDGFGGEMMLNRIIREGLKVLAWIAGVILSMAAVLLLILTISEYKPKSVEEVEVEKSQTDILDEITGQMKLFDE